MVRNFVNSDLAKNSQKYLPILGSYSHDIFYPNNVKRYGYSHSKKATLSDFYRKECQSMLTKENYFFCAEESVRNPSLLEKKIEIIDSHMNKSNIKLKMVLITELGVGLTMIAWGILKNI